MLSIVNINRVRGEHSMNFESENIYIRIIHEHIYCITAILKIESNICHSITIHLQLS